MSDRDGVIFNNVIRDLLSKGLITVAVSTAGSFTFGATGAFLGPAAVGLISILQRFGLTPVASLIERVMSNQITPYILPYIEGYALQTFFPLLIRLCKFFMSITRRISESTRSGLSQNYRALMSQ